jgi:hypothetical protein
MHARKVLPFIFEAGSCFVTYVADAAQDGLELKSRLSWDYTCAPLHLAKGTTLLYKRIPINKYSRCEGHIKIIIRKPQNWPDIVVHA